MDTARIKELLERNLADLRSRIAAAAGAADREPGDITLVGVTKKVDQTVTRMLLELGLTDLGENRVPDLVAKHTALGAAPPTWHFIGPLQRNKVRKCLQCCTWIHALESERLLLHMDRIAGELEVRPKVLIEVNLSGEKRKHGVSEEGFGYLLDQVREAAHLDLQGLMTIGPLTAEPGRIQAAFARLRTLLLEYCPDLPHLSMGMSQDLEIGVAEGATMVRVGSYLYRGYQPEEA